MLKDKSYQKWTFTITQLYKKKIYIKYNTESRDLILLALQYLSDILQTTLFNPLHFHLFFQKKKKCNVKWKLDIACSFLGRNMTQKTMRSKRFYFFIWKTIFFLWFVCNHLMLENHKFFLKWHFCVIWSLVCCSDFLPF